MRRMKQSSSSARKPIKMQAFRPKAGARCPSVSRHGVTFGPAAGITYQPRPILKFGIEYYGYWGEFGHFENLRN